MATKSKRRKIVTEEEYQAGLSNVVQQQFFPDLPHLAAQSALYDRRAAGDVAGAVAIRRAMRQQQDEQERQQQQEQPTLSLTEFHASVTSEDNAEFAAQQTKYIEENRQRLRLEYGKWGRLANAKKEDPLKALPPSTSHFPSPIPMASNQFDATPHRPSLQQLAKQAEKIEANGLFFLPNARSDFLALPPSSSSSSSGKLSGSNNEGMLPPSAEGSKYQVSSLPGHAERGILVPKPDHDRTRRVVPAATRYPSVRATPATATLAKYHGNRGLNLEESETDDDSSTLLGYSSAATDVSTDLSAAPTVDLATERLLGQRRRQRQLETLVPMTPVIIPGKTALSHEKDGVEGDGDEPLMTWGEVSATPLVLGGKADEDEQDSDKQPSFGVASANARDYAAERARERMEERTRLATATPQRRKRPSSTKVPVNSSIRRPASVRSANSFGSALRSSYTPKLGRTSSSRRSVQSQAHRSTPKLIRPGQAVPLQVPSLKSSKGDVTKGLLQLKS